MPRRLANLFNFGRTNRNDQPDEPNERVAANDQRRQRDAAHNAPPRAPRQHGEARQRSILLSDLRIGNEPAHALVNVPVLHGHALPQIAIPVDQASNHLTGRAYLEFLSTDARLFGSIRQLLASDHILAADPPLTPARLENMATRLRPLIAAVYHDNQRGNLDLAHEINRLATDVADGCGDRLDYMLRQMEDAALLARLYRGDIDEVTLYNHGIAFFMLDRLISEVGREATRRNVAADSQNVHAQLDAIYRLQDVLHLPHRQTTPNYSNLSFVSERVARQIGERVHQAATVEDGERVIEFMSTWGPWVRYLQNHDSHRTDFAQISQNYNDILEQMAADRDNPNSPLHHSVMDQVTYSAEIGTVGMNRDIWMADYVGQLTRTFLINHRADYLAEEGALPNYFR